MIRKELITLCLDTIKKDIQEAIDTDFGNLKEVFFDAIWDHREDEDPDGYDLVFSKTPIKDALTEEIFFNRAHIYVETDMVPTNEEEKHLKKLIHRSVKYLGYAQGHVCFQTNEVKNYRAYLVKKPGYKGPVHAEPSVLECTLMKEYKAYRLVTEDEVKTEGRSLNHCVGRHDMGYLTRLKNGEIELFSIRTPENKPLFTVEKRGHAIVQIKGSKNRLPGCGHGTSKVTKPDELEVVLDFLTKKNITPGSVQDLNHANLGN